MSKLAVRPDDICWDIGSGSGSVSVEMGFAAHNGRVFALDKSAQAVRLTEENCRKFKIGNVIAAQGEAPAALKSLPEPDVVFIGGSGGKLRGIITAAGGARLVVTAVTLESAHAACGALSALGRAYEITRLSVERGGRILKAENSVTIISAV
jgi:precorrin-6Y C5,15-methyltransferase (decarboxylating)